MEPTALMASFDADGHSPFELMTLPLFAAIAPLVGLLGTVLGMFKAFGGIASDVAAGAKPVVLAQGVSQAIVTTILGLAVAIPSLVAYAVLRRRAAKRISELEAAAEEVLAGGAR